MEAAVLPQVDASLPHSLDRLMTLLRFKSIATDPACTGECRKTADWLCRTFAGMGFDASIHETTGQPVVIATCKPAMPGKEIPHVLFYGHYDVQPADPESHWTSPPFQPEIRRKANGKEAVFARGSADDKGQFMTFVEAVRAWRSVHGALPFKLTILIEGDEEGDNSHFDRFVASNRKLLQADVAWICDTNMWDARTPAIITALRGCIGEEVFIHGPRCDLHSGYYGGPAINPLRALSRVVAGMHDAKGRITIPGFYQGVQPLQPATRKKLRNLPFNGRRFMAQAGLTHAAGESGFSVLEQIWHRPTCEVNGIVGGYTGPGSKTVLPSEASAKFTFRLVQGQDPRAIRRAFHTHVRSLLPPDCRASFVSSGGDSTGVAVDQHSTWINLAKSALLAEWRRVPVKIRYHLIPQRHAQLGAADRPRR
jgi:acetylornithine deacetylase/succinyl-diaminopimelate desuccinylase-like protein